MSGLRMPAPVPVVISKRKKLSLRDESLLLRPWVTDLTMGLLDTVTKGVTLRRKVEIMRCNVQCAGCGRLMKDRSEYQYDHEIAREISGNDGIANLRPYCVSMEVGGMSRVGCHNLKTARDQAIIAKGKRIRGEKGRRNPNRKPRKKIAQRKDDPWPKGKRKIPSRPFQKRSKRW